MTYQVLKGMRVAVLLDTEYIPAEIDYYRIGFSALGASVDFLSNLWGKPSRTIVSDVDALGKPVCSMMIDKDIKDCHPEDYDIILMAANYCSVRLREIQPMGSLGSIADVQSPPAVQFFRQAMLNTRIIKGALCHALWILTPCPEVLQGRRVICHTVVLADVHNAGAIFVADPSHVVVDGDLVTGRSAADIGPYFDAVVHQAIRIRTEALSPAFAAHR